MKDLSKHAIQYFQAPEDYFWKWAEQGNVLEFVNGRTICYREDLTFILKSLDLREEVPLGTVLLLLCACKDNCESLFDLTSSLRGIFIRNYFKWRPHDGLDQVIDDAAAFLKIVNSLPFEYRSGLQRVALLQAILGDMQTGTSNRYTATLHYLNSGGLDEYIFAQPGPLVLINVKRDIEALQTALGMFPDKEALELRLRTGLFALPPKAGMATHLQAAEGLFEQLDADLKTAGLSRLAKKIMGALNIPMHLNGSSDQSLGGVSDISNRGHLDKLLLSELAQDDLLLTARLANNEALFLQREQLPANEGRQWHILLDTTLKMWGLPRIFGMAAALAFSEGSTTGSKSAWALGGKSTCSIDLSAKAGIIDTLEKLDPAISCGRQLIRFIDEQKNTGGKHIFITGSHYKDDVALLPDFLQVRDQMDFLVTVDRSGQIELTEIRGKGSRLINKALINLDEALFAKPGPLTKKRYYKSGLPAMMTNAAYSLLFPASKIRLGTNNTLRFGNDEVAIITQDRRVLYWVSRDRGAEELVDHLDSGDYYWGRGLERLYILVINRPRKLAEVYQIDLVTKACLIVPLSPIDATDVRFADGYFHIKAGNEISVIDPATGKRAAVAANAEAFAQPPVIPHFQVLSGIKKMINNGYSVINSAKSVYVHTAGRLFVDHRELRLDPKGQHLSFKENNLAAVEWIKPVKQENMEVEHLPNIKFTKFIWKNGSEAVLDSRGLLHLKSADAQIAEVSILLVIEKTTACWSADGRVTGSVYFTGSPTDSMTAADFYETYIQRFIDALK